MTAVPTRPDLRDLNIDPTTERMGSYGIDAPYVPVLLVVGGLALIVVGSMTPVPVLFDLLGVACFAITALFAWVTLRGKFVVWDQLIDDLHLEGHEQIADLGCGRGAVLLTAARQLTIGTAHGVDLWRSIDQSGNSVAATTRNIKLERVGHLTELHTGDLRSLPLANRSVDVVLSSLAIHNVSGAVGQAKAIDEAMRILKPGGRLVIVDIRSSEAYVARLEALGALDVTRRPLGWNLPLGQVVTATKPA